MNQPICVLRAGSDPACDLGAEMLRCEGFPWLGGGAGRGV